MKVLFIRKSRLGDPGAADAHYIPRTLAKIQVQVALIALAGGETEWLSRAGVHIIEVGAKDSWWAALRSVARSVKPQIVHVFLHHGCGFYPFILRNVCEAKFVLDIRSPAMKTGLERRLRQCKNFLETIGYHALTAHGVESGITKVGPWRKIHWVPNGVDFSAIPKRCPEEEGRSIGKPLRLVYIGSLHGMRRVHRMFDAVSRAAQGVALSLDIYAYDECPPEIKRRIADLGMQDTFRFLKPLPRERLFERLGEYDIGLAYVPKVPFDSAPPLKTVEFLACGLPVLATDTTGNRIFVRPGLNGLLAEDDPVALSRGIVELAAAPWYPEARKRARSSVEPFNWERVIRDRLIPVYRELLAEEGNAAVLQRRIR